MYVPIPRSRPQAAGLATCSGVGGLSIRGKQAAWTKIEKRPAVLKNRRKRCALKTDQPQIQIANKLSTGRAWTDKHVYRWVVR